MTRSIALMMILLCTTSCSTVTTEVYCPPIKAYTKEQQKQVVEELQACGDKCSETKEFLKDGYVLRQSNRECAKK